MTTSKGLLRDYAIYNLKRLGDIGYKMADYHNGSHKTFKRTTIKNPNGQKNTVKDTIWIFHKTAFITTSKQYGLLKRRSSFPSRPFNEKETDG